MRKIIDVWFDIRFSKYKLYRRLLGGTWYHVQFLAERNYVKWWSRTKPLSSPNLHVIEKEIYGNKS